MRKLSDNWHTIDIVLIALITVYFSFNANCDIVVDSFFNFSPLTYVYQSSDTLPKVFTDQHPQKTYEMIVNKASQTGDTFIFNCFVLNNSPNIINLIANSADCNVIGRLTYGNVITGTALNFQYSSNTNVRLTITINAAQQRQYILPSTSLVPTSYSVPMSDFERVINFQDPETRIVSTLNIDFELYEPNQSNQQFSILNLLSTEVDLQLIEFPTTTKSSIVEFNNDIVKMTATNPVSLTCATDYCSVTGGVSGSYVSFEITSNTFTLDTSNLDVSFISEIVLNYATNDMQILFLTTSGEQGIGISLPGNVFDLNNYPLLNFNIKSLSTDLLVQQKYQFPLDLNQQFRVDNTGFVQWKQPYIQAINPTKNTDPHHHSTDNHHSPF
jgi:hypothetical protein